MLIRKSPPSFLRHSVGTMKTMTIIIDVTAFLHSAVDGGLSPFGWRLDEELEWCKHNSLPKGHCGQEVSGELRPDYTRVEAVCSNPGTCKMTRHRT
ncbi:hypothetical protein EYF80_043055 [Liparis tanakae]|uniref:Uncharacterized protein n=1 Tax=Liparis tanakae TaxID=230148 RepID=A0A4Z2G2J4_9TELE|nr:hypothetical protein EYF80_043055 [Liparis tanakae]